MKKLYTERDVFDAAKKGITELPLGEKTIITPAAKDAAKEQKIRFVSAKSRVDKQASVSQEESKFFPNQKGKIAIAADHGGYQMKEKLIPILQKLGHYVEDYGTFSTDAVDYPDFAKKVAERVSSGEAAFGIILDSVGVGSAMVANKYKGVRAATCNDLFTARSSREHNAANVLTIGAKLIGDALAEQIVMTWLCTPFAGGRHLARVEKIE